MFSLPRDAETKQETNKQESSNNRPAAETVVEPVTLPNKTETTVDMVGFLAEFHSFHTVFGPVKGKS